MAIVDKADFGSGTSFNNLKTVHGGIRYLQHADFKRMRESIRERRNLMRIAPHLVHPLPFLVPTYRGSVVKSRTAMRAAMLVNDVVSWDRNLGGDRQKRLPAGRALSPGECLALAPGLEPKDLTGGVVWHDAQMYNPDRLTLSFVLSAAEEGAVAANYVEATGLIERDGAVKGIRAKDTLTGDEGLEVRARAVVNASGPWIDALTGGRTRRLFHLSKAMNLITRPIVQDLALCVSSRREHHDGDRVVSTGGRFLCLIPWRHVTLVGTSHGYYDGEVDSFEATEDDVQELLDDVNDAYPDARLKRHDVRLVHRGLLPRAPESNGDGVTLEKNYRLQDHAEDGLDGLVSIVGVKYTTARDVAEKAIDLVLEKLQRVPERSRSQEIPLVGGDIEDFAGFLGDAVERQTSGRGRHDAPRAQLRNALPEDPQQRRGEARGGREPGAGRGGAPRGEGRDGARPRVRRVAADRARKCGEAEHRVHRGLRSDRRLGARLERAAYPGGDRFPRTVLPATKLTPDPLAR